MAGAEIELIGDDDGYLVAGLPKSVAGFLRSKGLWSSSTPLDLERLKSLLGAGGSLAQAGSEIAANSARWVKLTAESAELRKTYGLMATKKPGVSHAMIGRPGTVQKWLQIEDGVGPLLSNPAMLSCVGGLMQQAAAQQAIADIKNYLAKIDSKLDDVLRKVDDTVRKDMTGAGFQIQRAMTMREHEGRVTDDSWATIQNVPGKLADVQAYALKQLDAIAEKLESDTKVSTLAKTLNEARLEVKDWLVVLATCFEHQRAFDILMLDRALEASPDDLDRRRHGLKAAQREQLDEISKHTAALLERMNVAVDVANGKLFWNWAKSPEVIQSSNDAASEVHEFHRLLEITSSRRSWERRKLGRVAELSSQIIQTTKDQAPAAGGIVLLGGAAIASVVAKRLTQDNGGN